MSTFYSRPLYGGLLSQLIRQVLKDRTPQEFSSPPRGLLSQFRKMQEKSNPSGSRPLYGGLLSQSVPYTSQNTRLLSPICGANPQMREISISNWCITFSKPDFKPIGAKSLYFLKFNPPPSPYDTAFPDTLYIYRHAVPV